MVKAALAVHAVLWSGLLLGGLCGLPDQIQRLITHRTETSTEVTN
jgi:hypothetical protein